MRRVQEAHVPLFERTRLFKAYCSTVVPGLLQTPAYAGVLLSVISAFHGTPDDVEDAVAARMSRNRHLTPSPMSEGVCHVPLPGTSAGVWQARLRLPRFSQKAMLLLWSSIDRDGCHGSALSDALRILSYE
jgi:hypothetical protein